MGMHGYDRLEAIDLEPIQHAFDCGLVGFDRSLKRDIEQARAGEVAVD